MTRDLIPERVRGGGPVSSATHRPAGSTTPRPAILARLRQAVASLESGTAAALPQPAGDAETLARWRAAATPNAAGVTATPAPGPRLTLGIDDIDSRLPGGGLSAAGVHEIAAATPGDGPCAAGFAATLMVRRLASLAAGDMRPVLWCRHGRAVLEQGRLYAHGLAALGLGSERLLSLSLNRPRAILWTIEEALKSTALCGVVADMTPEALDLTASRRLMLAAGRAGVPCLLVFAAPPGGSTAAFTRWRIASQPSGPPAFDADAPGLPAWVLTLERSRAGRLGQWTVEWHHATHRFALVSPLLDRPFRLDEAARARAVAGR